jgi:probable F420-dependent oxidoreductase
VNPSRPTPTPEPPDGGAVSDPLILPESLSCGTVIGGGGRDDVIALARRIEAAGLDSAWVGDHVSFYIPILESLTLLSFVAGVTSRVRLGTGVYLVPLRHPTHTAKVTSTLDVLSGGRLTLGIGVGGEFPPEFEACGVPVAERGARTDESLEIIRRLWTEDEVVHEGEHFSFGPVTLAPKPLQSGGPPVIVGGRKGPSFRRAGRVGDGYISHMCSPEHYVSNLETIRRHAREAGRSEDPFETTAFLFSVQDDVYEKALDRAAAMLQTIYNRPFRDAARKYCLLGRPEDWLEQMQAFARAGARHFVFSLLSDGDAFFEAWESTIRPGLAQIDF